MKIEIRHIPRIEGHANLVVDAHSGELLECRLDVVETPRFFEAMLKGKHFSEVAHIASRICGVCSHSHTLASLTATENALGIETTDQTRNLRRLLTAGEILQSHFLHIFFMALPDYLGVESLFALAASRRDLVSRALRLKKAANEICAVVGGRAVHPVTPTVGGFHLIPTASALQGLRRTLVAALDDLEGTVELCTSFEHPEFARETEYVSLSPAGGYPLLDTTLVSTDGPCVPVEEYATFIEEYVVPHSTAKFARATRSAYMVGPLARYRNGHGALLPMALQVAEALSISPATVNPYHALSVRLVEAVHWVENSIHLIDETLLMGLRSEALPEPKGGGEGTAAIEAPRGTLFHSYAYDWQGCLERADCVIPTAQNLGNIEADLKALVPAIAHLPQNEITRRLEMLVRAYDPCISCSTHLVRVRYV